MRPAWIYCTADWWCPECGFKAMEATCLGDYERRYVKQHDFRCHQQEWVEETAG